MAKRRRDRNGDDGGEEFGESGGGVAEEADGEGGGQASELGVEGLVAAGGGGVVAGKVGLPAGAEVGEGVEQPGDQIEEGDDGLVGPPAVAVEELGEGVGVEGVAEQGEGGVGEGESFEQFGGDGRGRSVGRSGRCHPLRKPIAGRDAIPNPRLHPDLRTYNMCIALG